MNCKEFEKSVPDFINKKMNFVMTKQFVEHLNTCPACKEELNIQFLIDEGLVRLEDGLTFDLQKEITELIKESERKVRSHEKYLRYGRIFEWGIMLGVLGVLLYIILV